MSTTKGGGPAALDEKDPRIRLFGALEVALGDQRLGPRDLGGVKPKQVLEILVMARGHPVSKDQLADELWGESLPDSPSAAIETYVSVLRRRLKAGADERSLIATEHAAYRFATERAVIDLDTFDDLLARALRLEPAAARPLLEEAVRLASRGEVLEDEPYSGWAESVRERYRLEVARARMKAAEAALALGDASPALAHAESVLEADPLTEPALRLAMIAHYMLGDQGAAVATFRGAACILRRDLDVEPLPATQALYQAILRHEPARNLLPTAIRIPEDGDRALVEQSSSLLLWATDCELRVTSISGGAVEALGLDPTNLVGRSVAEVFPSQASHPPADEAHRLVLKGENATYTLEYASRTFQAHVEPRVSPEGRAVGTVGVAIDITDRRAAEESLRSALEHYRDLYEEAPGAYFSTSADGRILMANRRGQELVGLELDELVGMSVRNLWVDTPDGRRKGLEILERFRSGEEIRGEELELQRADGSRFSVRFWMRPIVDGSGAVVRSRSFLEVIAPDKPALPDPLLHHLLDVLKHSQDPMLILDPERDRILGANLAVHKMLRYARGELLERRISDVHPGEMTKFLDFAAVVTHRGEGWTTELTCVTKTGGSIKTETAASRIRLSGRSCLIALLRPIRAPRSEDPERHHRVEPLPALDVAA